MSLIHGTCVAIAGAGVLIRGPSGSGKSDLALRLLDGGAVLVADDYCEALAREGSLFLCAPAAIAGKIEVRGFGIVRLPHLPSARLALVVDLAAETRIERMPGTSAVDVGGVHVPWMSVDPRAPSAAAKIRLAIRALADNLRLAP